MPATTQYTSAATAKSTAMTATNPKEPSPTPWIASKALCGAKENASTATKLAAKMASGSSVQRSMRPNSSAEKRVVANAMANPMKAPDDMGAAIKTATALRESGIRTQLYSEQKKFKHKIGYADKLGIPFVIFLGEDEINAGVVAVKDMESGEQVKVSLDEAAKLIHDGLAKKNAGKVICDK